MSPPEPDRSVLTSPANPGLELFEAQPIPLPVMLALQNLDQPTGQAKFLNEFQSGDPVRIDLFCRDSTDGFAKLRRAFTKSKQTVMVDALTEHYLKKKLPVHYAFFVPSLTPQEFSALLGELGKTDAREEAKKPGSGLFDKFVLSRFRAEDERDLARLLGVPFARWKHNPTQSLLPHDLTRPLADTTEAQVAAALAAKRSSANDESSEPVTSAVLAVPFWPEAARVMPARSKQIQEFLRLPPSDRDESVPVLLVLRIVNQ